MSQAQQTRDVVDELTDDHREALEMLDAITTTADPDRCAEMRDVVIAEVVRHAVAEEMYVYPAVREVFRDGDEIVAHDTEEHEHLERVMRELERDDPRSDRFRESVAEMARALSHHAHDEESEQFPRLRRELSADRLQSMGEDVARAKRVAPTRPHPNAPNAELFHKLAGPGVGLVDRLRDRLSGRAEG